MKKKEPRIVYYRDERQDEFSRARIISRKIDGSYSYLPQGRWKKLTHFFWYRMVALPLGFFFLKCKFAHRVVGREKLKPYRKEGFYLYGNHTQDIADALIPTVVALPKEVYVIVHPNNVSMPVLGKITPSLGALPLPDTLDAMRNFREAVRCRTEQGHVIAIYPEAHIWPYHTGIRNFPDDAFYYPVRHGRPVFCFTNTYHKKRIGRGARIVTKIDGPFFPPVGVSSACARRALRDDVYRAMCRRAAESTYTLIKYEKEKPSD